MVYCSLKETTYYESSANVLNYTLVDGDGNVIYYGHSIKNPKSGINRINITEIIRDYLHSNLEDDWDILSNESGYVCQQKDAIRRFSLINGELILETYLVLLDYEDVFTGEDFILCNPIDGKLDPRMKAFITQFHNEDFIFDLIGSLVFTHIKQSRTYTVLCTDFSLVTASTQDDWFTVSKSGNSLVVQVLRNEGEQRYGTITIAYPALGGVEYKTYTITQLERDYAEEYFTVEAISGGTVYFEGGTSLMYRKNDGEWEYATRDQDYDNDYRLDLYNGDIAEIVWNGSTLYGAKHLIPYGSTRINVYGNIKTICPKLEFHSFYYFFKSGVVSAENLVLPKTGLVTGCFAYMFGNCTTLVTAPSILPATTLAEECYAGMFFYCTSLVSAPALPATTLADSCYNSMFTHCISLQTAPELPATTLVSGCYNSMFSSCSELNYVKCMAESVSTQPLYYWLYNVSSTGTFVKKAGISWETGASGIPEGWTVQEE